MHYTIESSSDNQTVKLWSTKRLPFEPKGWLKEMREDLKKELKILKRRNINEILYGAYQTSSNETGYDLENILFYNVGNSGFSKLNLTGICFEKKPQPIELPPIEMDESVHSFSFYKMVSDDKVQPYWKKNQVLARWENVGVSSMQNAYSFWSSMRQGQLQKIGEWRSLTDYGLDIILHLPFYMRFSLPSESMKKLLDGVICAFHVHNGSNEEEVIKRLAEKIPYEAHLIKNMLQDSSTNLLGMRSLFHLRSNSIICNPADDQCVSVKIQVLPTEQDQCMISGQLFSVKQR